MNNKKVKLQNNTIYNSIKMSKIFRNNSDKSVKDLCTEDCANLLRKRNKERSPKLMEIYTMLVG